jgi:DNA polymerase (family X)
VPLDRLIAEERLTEIPGVGEAVADIITTLHGTGAHPSLENLRKEFPAGVLELLRYPVFVPEVASSSGPTALQRFDKM